ncbi:MAG: Chemotaxis protein PomA [Deltaproteobacteria bacterium ADurb.Bin510]|nr:MAG: Chemotaxis protein PomA [Deltaproteobacteria bacterium ADurb.Bin510]
MDLATLIGLVAAFGMVVWGIMMGGPFDWFVNAAGLAIVFGGVAGIIFINYPLKDVLGMFGVVRNVFRMQSHDARSMIPDFVSYAAKARREGILALEGQLEFIDDSFMRRGLELVIDGLDPQAIREILDTEIENLEERHRKGADILATIGGYAPAMGMIGTLIGLVQMLRNMNDPSSIGPAMAVAFLTTFYGAVLANMVALPMAGKLAARSKEEAMLKGMVVEGILAISAGDNPRIVERKLHAYLAPKLREESWGGSE